jgi:thioredoxin 1
MKVEMFYTPGCSACGARHDELRAAALEAVKDLEWREINVLDSVDHAVQLGVMTLPSLVIDGELVFLNYRPRVKSRASARLDRLHC